MTLPAQWLVNLNRGHFHFKPPPDDPVAYSRWEFDEGMRVWERFFSSRIDIQGRDVLDLGCGPGGKTCYLATLNPNKVVGVDFAAELIRMAEHAKHVLIPPGGRVGVEFVCVDASDLPFPDDYFDIITCSDAFEHFDRPGDVLVEAARVLKPGGLLAIDFAQWGSYNGHHLGDFFRTPWCHIFWSKDAVTKAVETIASTERNKIMDAGSHEKMDDLVKRRLDQFHNGLNGISLAQFERYLKNEKRLRIRWRKRTSAHPVLWPFIFVPGIRELAVARNVYMLEGI